MPSPTEVDLLAPFASIKGGVIHVDVKKLPVDVSPRWVARTIAVGFAKQARANLKKGLGPDGTPLPPLKNSALRLTRHAEQAFSRRGRQGTRGIDTGELLRSIKSESVGDDAVVGVEGRRGERSANGDKSAAETTFLDTFVANPDQKYVQEALQKVADAIAGALWAREAQNLLDETV